MKYNITWEYNSELETHNALLNCYKVAKNIYQERKFYIYPYAKTGTQLYSQPNVLIPNIDYSKIPNFWEKLLSSYDYKNKDTTCRDQQLFEFMNMELLNNYPEAPNYETLKSIWDKYETEIIEILCNKLSLDTFPIEGIIIRPTKFGPASYWILNSASKRAELYIREHARIQGILSGITHMLLEITYKHKLTWEETVAARDVLLNNSKISKILETEYKCGYLPLSRIVKSNKYKEYSKESMEFLTKIGLNKPFDLYLDSGKIMTSGKELKNLSINEKRLLMMLLKNSNKVVGIDELNSIINNEMEKFSMYAVTKSIQRLRDKLEANGIPSSVIQTIREEGYMFKA